MPVPFTIWRIELLHPALVHFPIAFLLGASICVFLTSFFRSKRSRARLEHLIFFQLLMGTVGAWLAVWSGEKAHEIVNRVICDPHITHVHSDWGWRTAYLATSALFLSVLSRLKRWRQIQFLMIASRLSLLAAVAALVYGVHFGASLVYLQAAAVHQPDAECSEFSD